MRAGATPTGAMSGAEAKGDGAKPAGEGERETTPTGFARFFVSRCRPPSGRPDRRSQPACKLPSPAPLPPPPPPGAHGLHTPPAPAFPAPQSKKKSVKMKLGDKLSMYYNEEVRGWRHDAAACQRPPACNGSGGCGGGWQLCAATIAELSVTLIKPPYTAICCSSSAG